MYVPLDRGYLTLNHLFFFSLFLFFFSILPLCLVPGSVWVPSLGIHVRFCSFHFFCITYFFTPGLLPPLLPWLFPETHWGFEAWDQGVFLTSPPLPFSSVILFLLFFFALRPPPLFGFFLVEGPGVRLHAILF